MRRSFLVLLLLSGICYARFDSNLVAWWKLNDNAATTVVVDSIGSNTGTSSANTDTKSVVGRVNNALTFDAVDDEVRCGSASAIDDIFITGAGGSISIWLKTMGKGENNFGRAIGKEQWFLQANDALSNLTFSHVFTGDDGIWSFDIASQAWQHIVVIYTADKSADVPTVFVNGIAVAVSTDQVPGSEDETSDAADSLIIGDNAASNRSWEGAIDNVMLFPIKLTAKEVKYLYHGGKGREVIGQRNPRGRYSGNRRTRQNIH